MFERALSTISYQPQVKATFRELRKRKYKTAIVSGGFKTLADRALRDLKIDHAFAGCELLWSKSGKLVHSNLLPSDYEGKLAFMKLIMREHGLKKAQCAFVGDGANDIPFAKAMGLSIAFNASPSLQKVCTYAINQKPGKEDFREILRYF